MAAHRKTLNLHARRVLTRSGRTRLPGGPALGGSWKGVAHAGGVARVRSAAFKMGGGNLLSAELGQHHVKQRVFAPADNRDEHVYVQRWAAHGGGQERGPAAGPLAARASAARAHRQSPQVRGGAVPRGSVGRRPAPPWERVQARAPRGLLGRRVPHPRPRTEAHGPAHRRRGKRECKARRTARRLAREGEQAQREVQRHWERRTAPWSAAHVLGGRVDP